MIIIVQGSRELKLKFSHSSGLNGPWSNHGVWNSAGIKAWSLAESRQQAEQSFSCVCGFIFIFTLWWPKALRRLSTLIFWEKLDHSSDQGVELIKLPKYLSRKKKDEVFLITSNSVGVLWGFTSAHPHLRRINIRKIYKNLLFSSRVWHYFLLLQRAKDCSGKIRNTVFIYSTYHGNEL